MPIPTTMRRAAVLGGAVAAYVPTTFASDAFTDTATTLLDAHTPTGGGTWTRHGSSTAAVNTVISAAGRARNSATGSSFYYHSAVPASADYRVSCDIVVRSDNNTSNAGVIGRANTATNDHYWARYNTNGDAWELYKIVSGTGTLLGSLAGPAVIDQVYRIELRMTGTLIAMYLDSVLIASATDATFSAAGRAGVRGQNATTDSIGVHLDNWLAAA